MTALGLAGSIEATLIMTDRRNYVPFFEHLAQQFEQGSPFIKFPKRIEDSAIDPVTTIGYDERSVRCRSGE